MHYNWNRLVRYFWKNSQKSSEKEFFSMVGEREAK